MNSSVFTGKAALVTGGLGFIGSNLARRLAELGASVTVVDSLIPEYGGNIFNVAGVEDRVRINISDVRDEHSVSYLVRGQDYLFNLAAQTGHVESMRFPLTDLDINGRAQLVILEACRQHNPAVKVVFASTRQVYGRPAYLPVDEKHPLCPVDVNGIHKIAGEWYHTLYNKVYGIRSCSLRLTNTYGPRMRVKDARQMFLGIWVRQLIEGKPVRVYGDGTQIRDLTYVDDAVEAFLLAAASDKANGEVFNLGGTSISLRDLAGLMVELTGSGQYGLVPFPSERSAIDIGDYYADYGKVRSALGWAPGVSLREGLTRTLAYYREHLDRYL